MGFQINKEQLAALEAWLMAKGCDILPPTNGWEVLRWLGKETGVLYSSGKTSGEYATKAIEAFLAKLFWDGGPVSTGRKHGYKKQKLSLLERDGNLCFYCNNPLLEDMTLEHLIPLSAGGTNKLSNMVLAHELCNQEAGHKTIVEKVRYAVLKRSSPSAKDGIPY